ncbi:MULTISPECIES: VOC family protein [unclassified Streptomyces]|uniref:VOC family protein n=1 Tax=unclassified Streptomyces TaxID=2593676 RepID=UPI000DAE910E|nr:MULTISPECIES: VOC family protein [unclassified Streptomyces]PZT74841.1 VOC family protein [Streptomyces sp. AC1-42T]PZT82175.1 VOC family protein [Streptomyces sp. AC1-42W]
MAVRLNHTILTALDRDATAAFLSDILGLPAPRPYGPFLVLQLSNEVSLDILAAADALSGPVSEITSQHYAFLVDEEEFDAIFGRVRDRGLAYWADPFKRHPGRIGGWAGGRNVYFDDPDGHSIEIMTRPHEMD